MEVGPAHVDEAQLQVAAVVFPVVLPGRGADLRMYWPERTWFPAESAFENVNNGVAFGKR